MRMFIAGEWMDKEEKINVYNPYDGSVIDTVPRADADDVERALASAVRGAEIMRTVPGYERYLMLRKAAQLVEERVEEFARTITMEEGKIIDEARIEASRAVQILEGSAEEAKRMYGEVIPLDGAPGTGNRFGFTVRVPCGVVACITPFNFPLHLVCHKVGPAIAGGNSAIIKPATDTPLSALKLTEVLLEAGLPPEAVQCVTGLGGEIGDQICRDPRVRKITFTGSRDVGEHICHVAGLKKVTMELGSNSPVIIMPDADLEKVAEAVVVTGYSNAGQVCISAQRIIPMQQIYGDFLDVLTPKVEAITTGDPLAEGVRMGPMIREQDAVRVNEWVKEAVADGAQLVIGGERSGTMHQPTVVTDVKPTMQVSCNEIFGPAVAVTPIDDINDAIALANDTNYGLSAGIFTQDIDWALRFVREIDSGNIHINWGPQWRADLMPYGGLKESGFGKEGPKYALEEMTETKMVVIHTP
ncbi:MAG: aldehyde dehydrogenase family protein [Candidatus Bipolaricaulia bacterium]